MIFRSIKKEVSIINVIKNDGISSLSPIKYGIQWKKSSNEEIIDSSSKNILENSEFEQGDSLSFTDQSTSVQNAIEKTYRKEKYFEFSIDRMFLLILRNNQIDSDNQTIQNQLKLSDHYSISNLDVTIPSNLSSSIDLEQFECTSTTSNLSEFLKD